MNFQQPSKWQHFQKDILLNIPWNLKYPLIYQNWESMRLERGLKLEYSPIRRWVDTYSPEIEKRTRRYLKPTNNAWKVDETNIKGNGERKYWYRPVDSQSNILDFILNAQRDQKAITSLAQNAIPQLVIQEVEIPEGDRNYVKQVINQDIIIYVLKFPDLENTVGIQSFIQTDSDIGTNNQVSQNIYQTTTDFPVFFPNYAQSNSLATDNNNFSLDFKKFINNDGVLEAVQFTNQQAYVEGNNNSLDFYSEQRIYDISGYDQFGVNPDYVFDETITFENFLENFARDNLLDSAQLSVQDVRVWGSDNNIVQKLDQSLATFIFLDEDLTRESPEKSSDLPPVQFIFQESFLDSNNNIIEQTIHQNIQFDLSFSEEVSNEVTELTGAELTHPKFKIDDFILPILDNTVEGSSLFENHEVLANQKNQQTTSVLGNNNTDIKNNNQILILSENETRELIFENPHKTFDTGLTNYFDSLADRVFTGSGDPALFTNSFESLI